MIQVVLTIKLLYLFHMSLFVLVYAIFHQFVFVLLLYVVVVLHEFAVCLGLFGICDVVSCLSSFLA